MSDLEKKVGVWRVRRGIREGELFFARGDVYDGPNVDRLDEKHAWVKARWIEWVPAEKDGD
jgi:hypothetical protein